MQEKESIMAVWGGWKNPFLGKQWSSNGFVCPHLAPMNDSYILFVLNIMPFSGFDSNLKQWNLIYFHKMIVQVILYWIPKETHTRLGFIFAALIFCKSNIFMPTTISNIHPHTHWMSCEFKSHCKSNLTLSKNNKTCCKSYLFCQCIPACFLNDSLIISIQSQFSLFEYRSLLSNGSLLKLYTFSNYLPLN